VKGNPRGALSRTSLLDILSLLYLRTKQYEQAEATIRMGLDLANELQKYDTQLAMLNRYGALSLARNDFEVALRKYEEAKLLALEKNSLSAL
jgi:tetratricopeptide (TPR) repeat protein